MSRQIAVLPEVAVFDFDRVTDAMARVLAVLGSYANKDGWCWPKLETLAGRMRKTEGAVSKMIGKLVAAGYVEMHYEIREGRRRCVYRVIYDRPLETMHAIAEDELEQDPAEGSAAARVSVEETLDENAGPPRLAVEESQQSARVAATATVTFPQKASDTFPQTASVLLRSSPVEQPSTTGGEAAKVSGHLQVLERWNAMAVSSGLPTARDTPKRRKVIAARLREPGWLEDFNAACAVIAASPWHRGANDRRWVATLDFLLRPDKATTLAEQGRARPAAVPSAGSLEEVQVGDGQAMSRSVFWRLCVDAGLAAPMQSADTIRELVERLHGRGLVRDPAAFSALVLHVEPWALAEIKFGKERETRLAERLASWHAVRAKAVA